MHADACAGASRYAAVVVPVECLLVCSGHARTLVPRLFALGCPRAAVVRALLPAYPYAHA
jgi:hypothetical protein